MFLSLGYGFLMNGWHSVEHGSYPSSGFACEPIPDTADHERAYTIEIGPRGSMHIGGESHDGTSE